MRQLILFAAMAAMMAVSAHSALADVHAGSLFTDNMVLQRDQPVPVWGTASPGEMVTVKFGKQSATRIAAPDGKWRVALKPLSPDDKPRQLIISGGNTLTFSNVLVGDVYICSGQSNMAFSLIAARNGVQEAAAANYPTIRLFTVGMTPSPVPLDTCGGTWRVCTPESVTTFSAVAYFFGRELCRQTNIPIGLIHTSWGGTPAETWTCSAALKAIPHYAQLGAAADAAAQNYAENKASMDVRHAAETGDYNVRLAAFYDQTEKNDPGTTGHWADPSTSTSDWKTVSVPVVMGSNPLGSFMGSIWHRKSVQIPDSWVGKDLVVHVGAVDDVDDTFVNGVHVGRVWYDVPNFWTLPRAYPVPAALVKSNTLTVAVRAFNLVGDIGMFGPVATIYVAPASDDTQRVSLAGDWQYKQGIAVAPGDVPSTNYTPVPGSNAGDPAALFNGMIAPLIPYAIRGAIWYQGESNAGDPDGYRQLFPAMISSWRTAWGQGEFPFYFVQLASFMGVQNAPVEKGGWAEIREAQASALALHNTAMAVTDDIGAANDIHPHDKQDVGLRLALPALAKIYGQHLVYSGPVYQSMEVRGNAARIKFRSAKGLTAHWPVQAGGADVGQPGYVAASAAHTANAPAGFAIAGPDKVFHYATATIDGDSVVLTSPAVAHPVAVRYAWASCPVCNLYNDDNLPAAPFRTDNWTPDMFTAANEPLP